MCVRCAKRREVRTREKGGGRASAQWGVKKYCQEWKKKMCRDNMFISAPSFPLHLLLPFHARQHLLKFIGRQAIMHNPYAFTLSFAFYASWLFMCWYIWCGYEPGFIIISIFKGDQQVHREKNGIKRDAKQYSRSASEVYRAGFKTIINYMLLHLCWTA